VAYFGNRETKAHAMVPLETVRNTLLERRGLLATAINLAPSNTNLSELLEQVDAALDRISSRTYGTCEICKESIEDGRLHADPLARSCGSHLSPEDLGRVESDKRLASSFLGDYLDVTQSVDFFGEISSAPVPVESRDIPGGSEARHSRSLRQRLVESLKAAWRVFEDRDTEEKNSTDHEKRDLEDSSRAHRLQSMLLPKLGFGVAEWETYYDYAPAGPVGGDYCDLVAVDGKLFLLLGDAVGKGIAGSMIASQLHSLIRALLPLELPLNQLFERINRILCESGAADYYATLVCGRTSRDGVIELVNAGHLPPLVLRSGKAIPLGATGLPLGLFYTSTYDVAEIKLVPGEMVIFYTDGITEALDTKGVEYGPERLISLAVRRSDRCPEELVRACVDDVTAFTAGLPPFDDRTVMVVRRA
jgi:sigma-B regulation protein RsbU (phosphoserine phosphatase)